MPARFGEMVADSMMGRMVGDIVGMIVGRRVGDKVGFTGVTVGRKVGNGPIVGLMVGPIVGPMVGLMVGRIPTTVKVTRESPLSACPAAARTVNVWAPVAAPLAILIATGTCVSVPVPEILAVTPAPEKVTALAPDRLLPVMMAFTASPRVPMLGLMPEIVGAACCTVKTTFRGLLVVPPGVVTVKLRDPTAALGSIVRFTDTLVSLLPDILSTLMPEPGKVTSLAPARFDPLIVAVTRLPGVPLVGLMPVITGTACRTVKSTPAGLLPRPPGVVTVKLRAPVRALVAIAMSAVTVLASLEIMRLRVTPVPEKVTS
jgi:hypothetical protein